MSDEIPDPLASLDQAIRGMADFARAVRAYHLALVREGFSNEQALALTIAWQTATIAGGSA